MFQLSILHFQVIKFSIQGKERPKNREYKLYSCDSVKRQLAKENAK